MDRTQEQPRLTFSQRNGEEPLPKRMQLREMDERARNILYKIIHDLIDRNSHSTNYLHQDTAISEGYIKNMLADMDVELFDKDITAFLDDAEIWKERFRMYFYHSDYNQILDVVEFMATHKQMNKALVPLFQEKFKVAMLAYRMDDSGQIIPIASPEEGMVIQESLRLTRQEGMQAVRGHLLSAGKYINQGDWRDSVRESIHAVEAVGRLILKNPSATLGDFIKSCDKRVNIHPQLREMLKKFSAYADDHARHADKPDSSTPPDMADAVLLFGSCASFVTYLINKSGLNGAAEVS